MEDPKEGAIPDLQRKHEKSDEFGERVGDGATEADPTEPIVIPVDDNSGQIDDIGTELAAIKAAEMIERNQSAAIEEEAKRRINRESLQEESRRGTDNYVAGLRDVVHHLLPKAKKRNFLTGRTTARWSSTVGE